jgi:hypothetical protein
MRRNSLAGGWFFLGQQEGEQITQLGGGFDKDLGHPAM